MMMKKLLAVLVMSLAQAAQSSTPVHAGGLGGWFLTTFSYLASPDGSAAALQFTSSTPGYAVIGTGMGPDLDGKLVDLSVTAHADMSSLDTDVIGSNHYQSFAAQGAINIRMLDGPLGNLLAATISGGRIQVDVVTHRARVELDLVGLSSGSLYLTGQPATLTLQGLLAEPPTFGHCADHAYKLTCQPGEQFLDDFVLGWASPSDWKVSTNAFVSSVPEPGTAGLMVLGAWALSRRVFRRPAALVQC